MNENSNSTNELNGFKWRGGRQTETIGIWMWSEIFTHDFSSGIKIAIFLLDTQGLFDHQMDRRECTTTFALSMLLSSVQCYNIMQNIQKDDLENLEMFAEYGRLALEKSIEKPFQKLIFLIRDWPNAFENGYGWNDQNLLNDLFNGHTAENRQTTDRIKECFEDLKAFLMPYPGNEVAQGKNTTGNLKQIDKEFIKYVKELVPALFAPENLIIKKINNRSVRVSDLFTYLQVYVNVFNENKLPEPTTVLGVSSTFVSYHLTLIG